MKKFLVTGAAMLALAGCAMPSTPYTDNLEYAQGICENSSPSACEQLSQLQAQDQQYRAEQAEESAALARAEQAQALAALARSAQPHYGPKWLPPSMPSSYQPQPQTCVGIPAGSGVIALQCQ